MVELIRVARPGAAVSGPWARIVGVAPTIRQRPGGSNPDPVVYLPHRSAPSATAAIVVRATGEPTSLAPAIREELRRLDPESSSLPRDAASAGDGRVGMEWTDGGGGGAERRDHRVAHGACRSLRGDGTRRPLVESGDRSSDRARGAATRCRVDRAATGARAAAVGLGVGVGLHLCLRPGVHCRCRSQRSGQADGRRRAHVSHGDDRPSWRSPHARSPCAERSASIQLWRCARNNTCDDSSFDCSTSSVVAQTTISIARWQRILRCWRTSIAAAVDAGRSAPGRAARDGQRGADERPAS